MQDRNGVKEQQLRRSADSIEIFFCFGGLIWVRCGSSKQIALFVQREWEEVGKSVSKIVGEAVRNIAAVESIHRLLLPRLNPQISGSNVGYIFRPTPV